MHCTFCEKDVNPVYDMGSDMRAVAQCPKCSHQIKTTPATSSVQDRRSIDPSKAQTVLQFAKARLIEVRAQITDVSHLEAEAAMLERMISAAEDREPKHEKLSLLPSVGRA